MSGEACDPRRMSWMSAAESASTAASAWGLARKRAESPAAREKLALPTGFPPPPSGTACALAAQKGGASSPGTGVAIAAATAALVRATAAGIAAELTSVSNLLPVQYQRWSATWPLIMTAERSLPETATLRLAGHLRFISSPSVGTRRWTEETL